MVAEGVQNVKLTHIFDREDKKKRRPKGFPKKPVSAYKFYMQHCKDTAAKEMEAMVTEPGNVGKSMAKVLVFSVVLPCLCACLFVCLPVCVLVGLCQVRTA